MLTIFKSNKNTTETTKLTPKIAGKIAKKAKIKPTSYEDIIKDIELRAERGYTWTYMLQVNSEIILKLKNEGWNIRIMNKNKVSENFLIRISW